MSRKSHAPRVSAAYSALLVEALGAGGQLVLTGGGAGSAEDFARRLLQANILTQLELLRITSAPEGHIAGIAHVFALTPSGEALARAAAQRSDIGAAKPAR